MKIKVTPKSSTDEKPFPKLMISKDGSIIFFQRESLGICLQASNNSFFSEVSHIWDMELFQDFDGKVELEND